MFGYFYDTEGFPARWNCGTAWAEEPWLGWTHVVADLMTAAAYTAIPLLLIVVLRRVRHVPAPHVVTLFAVFILACGTVHLIDAIIFWWPIYRLSAVAKVTTAAASVMTVIAASMHWPKLLLYRSPEELQAEVELRTRQLEETNQRLGLALEAGAMGTWDWDLDTGNVWFDETQQGLIGLAGHEDPVTGEPVVKASDFFELVAADHRGPLSEAIDAAIHRGEPYNHEFLVTTPQGTDRWLSGRGRVVYEDGRPRRVVGVNFDITRQKRSQEELAKARREAEAASLAKSRFLANTSHEIRTPLTAILGCAEVLARDPKDSDTAATADLIQRQGRLLQRLLSDVLDLSKIEAGRLTVHRKGVCDVPALLEDVRSLMQPLATEKGLDFRIDPNRAPLPYLQTDPIRLRQVLVNLLSNAIKYTEAGSVEMMVATRRDGEPSVVFTVSDTGIGIAPEQQQAVFEAFHQVQAGPAADELAHSLNEGVGLGLAISAKLARLLGGEIAVDSQPGRGSAFRLRLPLVVPSREKIESANRRLQEATGPSPAASGEAVRRGKLLVAEDTASIQHLLKRILARHAEELCFVQDGASALSQISAAKEAGRPFDVLLLDMNMPVMSGYEAARRLRDAGETLPIIALTASAMVGDRERCLEAGCTEYVAKPIDWGLLESAVQASLASRAPL
ncbi:ATP-binding protein [Botrimarina sp.]|uniref:hybrid sensor histidine kinase/response regulator n=1 Tax=Botrimarina sp. TaxID=2795802 RepID=UPI0032F03BCF